MGRGAWCEDSLEQLAEDPELGAHVTGIVHRAGQDEGALEGYEDVVGQSVRIDGHRARACRERVTEQARQLGAPGQDMEGEA